jgi:hypothetical protein
VARAAGAKVKTSDYVLRFTDPAEEQDVAAAVNSVFGSL